MIPVVNTVHLNVYLSSQLTPPVKDTPLNFNLSLYDPSNVLVYTDNKPIPIQTISSYYWQFTLPASALLIPTYGEARYTALVTSQMASGNQISNVLKIETK